MDIGKKAQSYHDRGFNCAQSVFCSLGEYTGLDEKTALAVAGGFGGGLKSGEVCGAISGAVMALGLCFPYTDETRPQDKARIYDLAHRCVEECGQKCGKVTCRELLAQAGGTGSCGFYIASCAEIAEKMIRKNKGDI